MKTVEQANEVDTEGPMAAANTTAFRRSVTEALRSLGPRLQVHQVSEATPEAPIEQVVKERLYGKRRSARLKGEIWNVEQGSEPRSSEY